MMTRVKLWDALKKIIPPSRFRFERRETALVALLGDLSESLRREIHSLQVENRALRHEIEELREKDIAGLAECVRREVTELREKGLLDVADEQRRLRSQFDFLFKHFGKGEIEKDLRAGLIPMRFYKNTDSAKRNWGDELNINLFEAISNGKVKVIRTSDKGSTDFNILSIGSICSELNWGSVIWGAGLISEDYKPNSYPIEVRAVRGPLTRKVLREKGVDCPAVYGDPALLLPLFYRPVARKHHRVTVVPHYVDADSGIVARFNAQDGFHVIDMRSYGDWRDVIDTIVNSDFVISSSLHGLIVAEAYGVPSLWVEFSDKILGKWFKYRDFYESIGKRGMKPVRISEASDLGELLELKQQWQKGSIDIEPLLKSCPFPIVNRVAAKEEESLRSER